MNKDKKIEKIRYEDRALAQLKFKIIEENILGSQKIRPYLREPYLHYERIIKKNIQQHHKVLEIGSGTGMHTFSLLRTGAQVTASDISPSSIEIINKKYRRYIEDDKLKSFEADIEDLPFDSESFDIITSAGSLSYGSRKKVDSEIYRVLKPNGSFICVDSLNSNPIYKFNRYIGYLLGKRSMLTIKNMLKPRNVNQISKKYSYFEAKYFGAATFMLPLISNIFDEKKAAQFSSFIDKKFKIHKSAFKLVFLAKK